MDELTDNEPDTEQRRSDSEFDALVRRIAASLQLPALAPLAFSLYYARRRRSPSRETTVSFEHSLYQHEYEGAWQALAHHALETDADVGIWDDLSRAASMLSLSEQQAEILRRGLRLPLPEPGDRRHPDLGFEDLLRRALEGLSLSDIPFSAAMLRREGNRHGDPRRAARYLFEDYYRAYHLRGSVRVLTDYARQTDADPETRNYLDDALAFVQGNAHRD